MQLPARATGPAAPRSTMQRILDVVERIGNQTPDLPVPSPILIGAVVALSQIRGMMGTAHPPGDHVFFSSRISVVSEPIGITRWKNGTIRLGRNTGVTARRGGGVVERGTRRGSVPSLSSTST